MKNLLFGFKSWQPFEKQIWMMSIAASVVWIAYVLISDVILFEPRSYERLESEMFQSSGARTTQQQMERLLLGPSSQDVARMEGRVSRNTERRARNAEVQRYNESYVQRALTKAFGIPIAWLGALLTFITIYERMRAASEARDNEDS